MTALDTDDLAVVTGPLTLDGNPAVVFLSAGEVVRVIYPEDEVGNAYVFGFYSDRHQWIDASSLTPLSEIHKDTTIEWGAEDEQYVRLCGTHDYVYTEDE